MFYCFRAPTTNEKYMTTSPNKNISIRKAFNIIIILLLVGQVYVSPY